MSIRQSTASSLFHVVKIIMVSGQSNEAVTIKTDIECTPLSRKTKEVNL